jgi:DNA end-binding protein Ku
MPRAIWSGSISFGLVNVPVGLYSATHDSTIHFNQFQKGTQSRIRNRRVNERTGKEVDFDDIVLGYEIDDDQYVILTKEELESVEPGKSRTIEITDFVEASDVDPIYYQRSYYLAPQDEAAERPYSLLVQAMQDRERIAIANFVMRDKQYLAAIRPAGKVLILETLYFADEVRDPADVLEDMPRKATFKPRDLDAAEMLLDAMTTTWDPKNYRDTYRDRVMGLIEAKAKGRKVVVEEEERAAPNVVDLMAALQESVERARKHRPGNAHHVVKLKTEPADDVRRTNRRAARSKTRSARPTSRPRKKAS